MLPKIGVEFDLLIAEKLMGWQWHEKGKVRWLAPSGDNRAGHRLPRYSTNVAAAWLVVDQLRSLGWLVRVQEMADGYPWLGNGIDEPDMEIHRRAVCMLYWMRRGEEPSRGWKHPQPLAYGDTSAEAICLAALQTVAESKEVALELRCLSSLEGCVRAAN